MFMQLEGIFMHPICGQSIALRRVGVDAGASHGASQVWCSVWCVWCGLWHPEQHDEIRGFL